MPTFTAHKYGKNQEEILDMTQFETADKAIDYAIQNGCDEVVNDLTGLLVYRKPDKDDCLYLFFDDNEGRHVSCTPVKSEKDALEFGLGAIIDGRAENLYIQKIQEHKAPARFISGKNVLAKSKEYASFDELVKFYMN